MILALLGTLALLQPPHGATGYVPHRVFDTRHKSFTDFESMLADVARADVIFVGEQHDNPNTHRLELAVVDGLMRRRVSLVIALEMFERDVQPVLDKYAAGTITEEEFLKGSRPWPRYATDYRPLIEFAREHHLPIVAANVPRPIAANVSKAGLSALDALGPQRGFAARELQCAASGQYYDRFVAEMTGHAPAADPKTAPPADVRTGTDRFFLAQCVKDETMAESVAAAFANTSVERATIVYVNGAFHTDYGQGAAERTRRRLPGRRVAILSMLPVDDIDGVVPGEEDLARAEYLVYTVR